VLLVDEAQELAPALINELPAFSTLLKIARGARARVNRAYQVHVCEALDASTKRRLLALLMRPPGSLDLASLNDMPERKRLTLTAALISQQVARALDDVAEMFIRQVQKMHNKAREALDVYRAAHAEQIDALVARLRDIALAYKGPGTREDRLTAIEALLAGDADDILAHCEAYEALAGNNYLPFLPKFRTPDLTLGRFAAAPSANPI
jgi:hypothetical protein